MNELWLTGFCLVVLAGMVVSFVGTRRRLAKLERLNRRAEDKLLARLDLLSGADEQYQERLRTLQADLKALKSGIAELHKSAATEIKSGNLTLRHDLSGLLQYQLADNILDRDQCGVASVTRGKPRLIVSLTTIPARLFEISGTVESLLRQTLQPDMIVLWVDEKVREEELPLELRGQMARGLSIRFCPDIGPHTKLIPALKEFPEDVIITVDDDIFYPPYLLELLYLNFLKDKSKIYCTRARRIQSRESGFDYMKDWPNVREEAEGLDIIPLGVGGVLYPPQILHEDVFDLGQQKSLCPFADDIWFKTMSLRRRVVCKRIAIRAARFAKRPFSQESSLEQLNIGGRMNEQQFLACLKHYELEQFLP